MKVLFIGGTGKISSACTPLAVERGIDLYLLNRGKTAENVPEGVTVLNGDIRDAAGVEAVLAGHEWDAVVDWIAFTTDHIETDLKLFRGRTQQYIFISSASAYQKPLSDLPITESTLVANPYRQYSRDKIACEEMLVHAYREDGFPFTIVRPSHTYNKTMLPFQGGYTVIDRMRKGKSVIVHGDGSSLWVLTNHRDFAKAFVPLLGNSHAVGETYHITSDELLTWDQIFTILGRAAGVEPKLVHVPSELINAFDPNWGAGLLGDKARSVIFDNSKVKRIAPDYSATIPFSKGAEEIIAWYDEDPARQVVDEEHNKLIETILEKYASAWPDGKISG